MEATFFLLKALGSILLYILWIFGGLLLVLLLLLALVLFVSFRYRIRFKYEEEVFEWDTRLTFLWRFFKAEISYKKKLFYKMNLLFFTIFSSSKKKKQKIKKDRKEVKGKEKKVEEKKVEESVDKTEVEKQATLSKEVTNLPSHKEKEVSVEGKDTLSKNNTDEMGSEKDFFEKMEAFFEKMTGYYEKGKAKIESFKNRFTELIEKKDIVSNFISSDGTPEGVKLLLTKSFHLVKAIFPKKIKGRVRFGTGDVYTEGQYLTYLCLFYGLYAETLEIEPEWEEKVFEADVEIQGKIRLFTILRICIKVYFNEDFKKLRSNIDFLRSRLGI